MSEDISISEAKVVLEKLYNERKAINKALSVVSKLANIEQVIPERQLYLDNINAMIAKKDSEYQELEANVSDLHIQRENACRAREAESAQKLEQEESKRRTLEEDLKARTVAFNSHIENLQIKTDEANSDYAKLLKDLQEKADSLKAELASLNAKARSLAGV